MHRLGGHHPLARHRGHHDIGTARVPVARDDGDVSLLKSFLRVENKTMDGCETCGVHNWKAVSDDHADLKEPHIQNAN